LGAVVWANSSTGAKKASNKRRRVKTIVKRFAIAFKNEKEVFKL
jgi:hypothetical protein